MVQFGQGELGEIVGGSVRYQLTWDDLLWAARMIMGEAGTEAAGVHGAAVLWSMANRFIATRGRFRTYTRLIQSYSQPINPKWAADGEFCMVGGRNHGTTDCSPDKLERRARHQTITWEEIPEAVQSLVHRWATALVQDPIPRAAHFAVPRVVARPNGGHVNRTGPDNGWDFVWDSKGRQNIDRTAGNGNLFVSTNLTRNWSADYVKIRFEQREATDSTVEAVSEQNPLASSGTESRNRASTPITHRIPQNDSFERVAMLTSNRTEPPNNQYSYLTDSVPEGDKDPQAQGMLTEAQSERILKLHNDRFYDQVSAIKRRSNVEMTQSPPIIMILTENDDGGVVNLNEIIFAESNYHGLDDNFDVFPERPLASLEGFEVVVQEPSVGGVTGIAQATLSLKVHNPEMVTRSHPKGKYIAYMMSQGYVLRIRYGIEAANESDYDNRLAFQWKEEDFFVTQYNCTIHNDSTMSLKVSLMPATHRLLNQMHIGESLPVDHVGQISIQDIDNAVDTVVGSSEEIDQNQIQALRSRLGTFREQFNSPHLSPGFRIEAKGSNGTFGSVLHAALTNSQIFENNEGIGSIPVNDMVTALQTIQATLLTRRFQELLLKDCYQKTHRGLTFSAINLGPLFYNIVKPEIDAAFGYVTRNQIEIGEKFSIDDRPGQAATSNTRTNVKLIFGKFNSRAGAEWANKPISKFPINAETIFSHLRQSRRIGDFSSTINAFFSQLRSNVNEISNYEADTSQGAEKTRRRIETPNIRYVIYPDPRNTTDWILYIYDNKVPLIAFRDSLDSMLETSVRNAARADGTQNKLRPPSRNEVKKILEEHHIPWIEMSEQGSFIKQFNAETASDDLLGSHNLAASFRNQQTTRDFDAAADVPAGISREWFAGAQQTPQNVIRAVSYVAPIRVSVQSYLVPTAYYLGPIFVFFPVKTFSGIYFIQELRHDIKTGGALTNMNLQINLTTLNQIAL